MANDKDIEARIARLEAAVFPKPGPSRSDLDAAAFREHAASCGLSADDLGREVTINGVVCKIVGLRPGAASPVVIETQGKRQKVRVGSVRAALNG